MIDMSPAVVTIVMLGGVLLGVMSGFPLAFAIGGVTLIVGYLTLGDPATQIIFQRAYALSLNYSLAAVPLFVFMGAMLEASGIADKLYQALYLWLSGFRGGLAVSTILIGTLLAACVGVISASVSLLTLIALPAMLRRGYDKSLASACCSAGGTLGILIPPSIMLVIYGPMALVSVGRLFMGAIFPGILLAALYCGYIVVRAMLQPEIAPAVPSDQRAAPFWMKTKALIVAVAPPGILILAVLGTIFLGIAPPTEAAAIGALVATLMTIAYRRFNYQVLRRVSLMTLRITSFAFLIGVTSFAFVGIFLRLGAGDVIANFVLSAPGGRWGGFFVVMLIIFILGMFVDWIGILFIMVPIISPIGMELGFDPVWFGIMICVNLQMAFNTPPLASALFIVKGTALPELGVTLSDLIRGIFPFVALIILTLVICGIFPQVILWLPGRMV